MVIPKDVYTDHTRNRWTSESLNLILKSTYQGKQIDAYSVLI